MFLLQPIQSVSMYLHLYFSPVCTGGGGGGVRCVFPGNNYPMLYSYKSRTQGRATTTYINKKYIIWVCLTGRLESYYRKSVLGFKDGGGGWSARINYPNYAVNFTQHTHKYYNTFGSFYPIKKKFIYISRNKIHWYKHV